LTRFAYIALFLALMSLVRVAPATCDEREKIADIVIKGNRRIETAAIANALSMKVGEFLYADRVDADIRAIYRLGQFQDVRAESEKGDKGVVLVFTVVEKPIVRDVKFEGNKELSQDKLREAVEIRTNAVFSGKELAKSIKKVKKLYADEGFYLAEVDGVAEKRSAGEMRVVFKIVEGKKIRIKDIRFEGNRAFTARKLRGVMETSEDWFLAWLTGAGIYKEEVLKNDAGLIADLYFNNGYVNVKVGEPKVSIMENREGLVVDIGITEGDQYRTGAMDFKGDMLESQEKLAQKLTMKTGDIFSRSALRTEVFALTDLYADKGYAFANVNPLTKVNNDSKTVDLTFDMEKGEQVTIDRITVNGNTKTRDKVIRRELKLAESELYSSTALRKSRQNLMNLGFFEEANISSAKGSAHDKLNLNVEVKEKPTGTFSIGGGYSSLDGFVGQGSVQQANFLGLGLKANAAASIGGKSQNYNVGVTDPYFLDTRWTLGFDVYRSERDYLDYTRRATGGDIKAGYPLSDTVNTFWVYKFEEKKIFNESQALKDSVQKKLILQPELSSTTSSITASINRNTTDYRLDPTTGMMNSLSAEFAGLGGSNRFARYIGNTTVFFPVIWNTVFSLRGELGYIQSIGKEIPIDEKFYLGGINTIRGYAGRTVSPFRTTPAVPSDLSGHATAPSNLFLGGEAEAVFNAEYQFPLIKEAGLKGLLFFDAGNSYESPGKMFSSLLASYGFGFRWFSPIGPLRLEYGIPLNPRTGVDKTGGRLEFSIGNFF
jgi:outer membrane protein insertion porin family